MTEKYFCDRPFDAFIFDMDGVILDSEQLVLRCWKEIAEKHQIPDIENTFRSCIGLNRQASCKKFIKRYGEDFPYFTYKEEMSNRFMEISSTEGLGIKPGIRELLEILKGARVPIAVASSSRRLYVTRELTQAGLISYFDALICGDMVTHSKPDPEIFLVAAAALGAAPDRSIVIEDSFNGIRAAYAGGFRTVMVPDMLEPTEEILAMTEIVLPSLHEVREMIHFT